MPAIGSAQAADRRRAGASKLECAPHSQHLIAGTADIERTLCDYLARAQLDVVERNQALIVEETGNRCVGRCVRDDERVEVRGENGLAAIAEVQREHDRPQFTGRGGRDRGRSPDQNIDGLRQQIGCAVDRDDVGVLSRWSELRAVTKAIGGHSTTFPRRHPRIPRYRDS